MNASRLKLIGRRFVRGAAMAGLIGTAMLAATAPAHAQELLHNPSFEVGGAPTTLTGLGYGLSAATNWTVWNQYPSTTRTDLVPYNAPGAPPLLPGGGAKMIHVKTTVDRSGLVQVFLPYNTGPSQVICGAWIYVVHGQVGIGCGNGGSLSYTAFTKTTGHWEPVQTPNCNAPANEFVIYASSSGGAEFYADLATVHAPYPDATGTYSGVLVDHQPERNGYIGATVDVTSQALSSDGLWADIQGTFREVDSTETYPFTGKIYANGKTDILVSMGSQEYIEMQGHVTLSNSPATRWTKLMTGLWDDVANGHSFAGGRFRITDWR